MDHSDIESHTLEKPSVAKQQCACVRACIVIAVYTVPTTGWWTPEGKAPPPLHPLVLLELLLLLRVQELVWASQSFDGYGFSVSI